LKREGDLDGRREKDDPKGIESGNTVNAAGDLKVRNRIGKGRGGKNGGKTWLIARAKKKRGKGVRRTRMIVGNKTRLKLEEETIRK